MTASGGHTDARKHRCLPVERHLAAPLLLTGSLARLPAIAKGCLLRPVPANRHATPPPGTTARAIHEQERAGRTLARLRVLEVAAANEPGDLLGDRQQ